MTRRKLLLWADLAVLGLAVLATIAGVVFIPPDEASRQIKKVEVGMTKEQVREILGEETSASLYSPPRMDWWYADGSVLIVDFDSSGLVVYKLLHGPFHPRPEPWYAPIRDRLRKAGLPI